MGNKDMLKGAEIVGKAAAEKFAEIKDDMNVIKGDISVFSKNQEVVNNQLIDHADEQRERLQALEDNRYYVKMSRHGLDDLSGSDAERLVAWIQRLIHELTLRGCPPSSNQQTFIANLYKYIGIQDQLMEIEGLDEIERFGDSGTHEVLYKIFLVVVYLHNNSFEPLSQLDDVTRMFRLSEADKLKIQSMLEDQRIPTLGVSGLVEMFNPNKPINSFSVESLIAKSTSINSHLLVRYNFKKEYTASYIKSFAIISPDDGKFSELQRNFINSIARLLGCPEALYELDSLCVAKQNVNIQQLQNILSTDEQKFAWGLDSAAILGFGMQEDLQRISIIARVMRSLNITDADNFISAAFNLPKASTPGDALKYISVVDKHCKGWKHIAEFSGLNFKDLFSDLRARLDASYWKAIELSRKCIEASANTIDSMDSPEAYSDNWAEKLVAKAAGHLVASKRAENLKVLLEIKNEADSLLDHGREDLRAGNAILKIFGVRHVQFDDGRFRVQKFDLDNSGANENWSDDYDALNDLLQDTLDKFSDATQILEEQLQSFEKGDIYGSVVDKKEEEANKKLAKERQKLEEKKVVKISNGDTAKKIKISWSDITVNLFDPADISQIASDGTIWVVVADEKMFCSSDGIDWSNISTLPSVDRYGRIFYANGLWIYISTAPELYFSSDLTAWQKGFVPDGLAYGSARICFFGGYWVLCAEKDEEYSYTEKGFIFDSKETAYYKAPAFYRSKSLSNSWSKWGEACRFDEGICLRSTHIATGDKLMISAFSMDPFYFDNKKKTSLPSFVSYIKSTGEWKQATLPSDKLNLWDCGIFLWNDKWICLCREGVMTSNNGYEWVVAIKDVSITTGLIDFGGLVIVLCNNQKTALVSVDGVSFAEITLTDRSGDWNHLAANEKGVLAVFAPSEHEAFLQKGVLEYID